MQGQIVDFYNHLSDDGEEQHEFIESEGQTEEYQYVDQHQHYNDGQSSDRQYNQVYQQIQSSEQLEVDEIN